MTSSLLWTSATFEPPRVHRGRNRHIVIISKLIESSYQLVLYLLFTIDFSAKFKFEKKIISFYRFGGLDESARSGGENRNKNRILSSTLKQYFVPPEQFVRTSIAIDIQKPLYGCWHYREIISPLYPIWLYITYIQLYIYI